MPKSLLEKLPDIVAQGRKEADRILRALQSQHRVHLQTRELVSPTAGVGAAPAEALSPQRFTQCADSFATFVRRQGSVHQKQSPWPDKALAGSHAFPARSVQGAVAQWINRLANGDNLWVMAALLAGDEHTPSLRGKVDLVYADPPFGSNADYRMRTLLPPLADTDAVKKTGAEPLKRTAMALEQWAYGDTWDEGLETYLSGITARLMLMRELLADTGAIYVHLDWHVGHYVKLILDAVFGKDNLVNEIIWKRAFAHGDGGQGAEHLGRLHDTIFWYRKSAAYTFHQSYTPYTPEYVDHHFRYADAQTGRRFQTVPLTGPGGAAKGNPYYEFLGVRRHWQLSHTKMQELLAQDRIYQNRLGVTVPRRKMYLDEAKGLPLQDIWTDIAPVQGQAKENLRYATQKPERLLSRLIQLASNPGDLVLDVYGGSGTTAAVADKLGRRWITADSGQLAYQLMRQRLQQQSSQPFVCQTLRDHPLETVRAAFGRDYCQRDVSYTVLALYGALPLPADVNPQRNLGQSVESFSGDTARSPESASANAPTLRTLVVVDAPHRRTGVAMLNKAIALRDSVLGGWDRVVLLGWAFEPGMGDAVAARTVGHEAARLEVLQIPVQEMDALARHGSLDARRAQVRFTSLAHLTLHPVQRQHTPEPTQTETLTITLKDYALLSPAAVHLDAAQRDKFQALAQQDPLALINYWAIDPDYDGAVFRSAWHSYRSTPTDKHPDPQTAWRVAPQAVLHVPAKTGPRTVCVRAVDVVGTEVEVQVL